MNTSDFKYLLAYTLPVSGIIAVMSHSWWTYLSVIIAFGLIPVLELFISSSTSNEIQENTEEREDSVFFDWLLYINVPLVYGVISLLFIRLSAGAYSTSELVGMLLSTGLVLSSNGINVAHELGHKAGKLEQISAKLLLIPCLYTHFTIEHNYGHHVNIATPEDPATSRKGEWVYTFWLRSSIMGYLGAWKIESKRLKRLKQPLLSFSNKMIQNTIIQWTYFAVVWTVFGIQVLGYALIVGTISFLLLESINYIEHYGLLRKKKENGRYETVEPIHSWNSNHEIGRILLYELTRHSDHHFKANRKYQVLRHFDESPQLPLGYPSSVLLAMVPPLWFTVMNPKLEQYNRQRVA